MVLRDDQILNIIKKPSNPNIGDWRKEHSALDIYVNGGDVSKELEQVKNYENASQKELRDKIARSTKDLLSYLLSPLNKVFSASGFNSDIRFSTNTNEKRFNDHLEKLPDGASMRKWMRNYWLEAFVTDPNGVLFIETENTDEKPRSYPTYKSILSIHDYLEKWGKFEYIVFLYKKVRIKESVHQIYRVYDDKRDALYYIEKDSLMFYSEGDEDPNLIHGQGYVPAVLPSNIVDKKTRGKKTFINKIDEILKEYMRDSSVHSIFKFLFGFPRFWSYAMKCINCQGTGKVANIRANETGQEPRSICPVCGGKRLQATADVSDGIRLALPTSGDDPKLAPDIAGYITPDLNTWQKQLDEMFSMRKDMFFSLWGTYAHEDNGTEKTATEVYVNTQPVMETLDGVSSNAEFVETTLVYFMAKGMYQDDVEKVDIKYGRRYAIETPDILWERYIDAKKDQSPISALDYLYKQFLMVEYNNDQIMLDQKIKEFYLEPFAHYSLEDLNGSATAKQIQEKLLYSEWVSGDIDFTKSKKELKRKFDEYINQNMPNEKITEVSSVDLT